jgi:hypothetical protein
MRIDASDILHQLMEAVNTDTDKRNISRITVSGTVYFAMKDLFKMAGIPPDDMKVTGIPLAIEPTYLKRTIGIHHTIGETVYSDLDLGDKGTGIPSLRKIKDTCAMRFNDGKPQWSLVDFESLEPMVRMLEYGAKKYDRSNWKKGLPVTRTIESLLRHTFALLSGEDNDPESGLPHIGSIQCNAMFLAHTIKHHPQLDDREKHAPAPPDQVPGKQPGLGTGNDQAQ